MNLKTTAALATSVLAVVAGTTIPAAAKAAPTSFHPSRYVEATTNDRAFLRIADGWANRLNGRDRAWSRCKSQACARDRVRMLSDTGSRAASSVRFALKYGVGRHGQPNSLCVRKAGSLLAHSAAAAGKLDLAAWTGQKAFNAAVKRYITLTNKSVRAAKACQRTLS